MLISYLIRRCCTTCPSYFFDTLFTYLLTYLLTQLLAFYTEQSHSWEANRFPASQEIPYIVRKPTVHYRIHKCPPPV